MKKILFLFIIMLVLCNCELEPVTPPEPTPDPTSSDVFHIWNFENNYEDNNGNNIWKYDYYTDFSTTQVKFNGYSLFAENNKLGVLTLDNFEIPGNDVSAAVWIYIESFPDTELEILLFQEIYQIESVRLAYFSAELTPSGTVKMYCYPDKTTGDINDFIESNVISLNTWHYIGISYSSSTRRAYLTVNDSLFELPVSGEWPTDFQAEGYNISVYLLFSFGICAANNDLNYNANFYIDEVIAIKSVAYNLFIQHYNDNIPWDLADLP